MSEHDEQVAVVSWFKRQYPKQRDCILAIPNGSAFSGGFGNKKNISRYKYLVAEGLKKGTSDLFIAYPNKGFHGLWIEMKDVKKTISSVTDEQIQHIDLMNDLGYKATWCAGADIAIKEIKDYMK